MTYYVFKQHVNIYCTIVRAPVIEILSTTSYQDRIQQYCDIKWRNGNNAFLKSWNCSDIRE